MKRMLVALLLITGCGDYPEKSEVLDTIYTSALECQRRVGSEAAHSAWITEFAERYKDEMAQEVSRLPTDSTDYDPLFFTFKNGGDLLQYENAFDGTFTLSIRYGDHRLKSEVSRPPYGTDEWDHSVCVDDTYCLIVDNTTVSVDDMNSRPVPLMLTCTTPTITFEHSYGYRGGVDMGTELYRETLKLTSGTERWFAEATVVQSTQDWAMGPENAGFSGVVCHNDRCRGEPTLDLNVPAPQFGSLTPDFVHELVHTIDARRKALADARTEQ